MKLKHFIGIVFSIIVIYFLIKNIDIRNIFNVIKNINYLWVLPLFIIFPIVLILKTYRWKLTFNTEIKFFKLYRYLTLGILFNVILPFRTGELLRAYFTGKRLHISKSTVMGTIVIERLFDLLSLLVLLLLFILLSQTSVIPIYIKRTAIIFFSVSIVLFFICLLLLKGKSHLIERIHRLPASNIKHKIVEKFELFINGLHTLHTFKKTSFIGVLSLCIWLLEALNYYFICLSFGFNLSFFSAIFVMTIICLGIVLPAGPGGIGIYEAACVIALITLGISKEFALSYAILIHFLQIIAIVGFGITSLYIEGLTLKDIKQVET